MLCLVMLLCLHLLHSNEAVKICEPLHLHYYFTFQPDGCISCFDCKEVGRLSVDGPDGLMEDDQEKIIDEQCAEGPPDGLSFLSCGCLQHASLSHCFPYLEGIDRLTTLYHTAGHPFISIPDDFSHLLQHPIVSP